MGEAKTESTALATFDQYRSQADRFNILEPFMDLRQEAATSDLLVEGVSLVQIKPDDCYNDFRYANQRDRKHAIGGLGLQKIAAAGGVLWVEPAVFEVDERRPDGHRSVRVRSTGAIRQSNGELYLVSKHKAIDTQDELEYFVAESKRARDRTRDPQKRLTDIEIEAKARDRMFQMRQHLHSIAETKAQYRVIRALFGLKQVFTEQELARPFVVPRLVYRGDVAGELGLRQIQQEASSAAERAFGPRAPAALTSAATGDDASGELSGSPSAEPVAASASDGETDGPTPSEESGPAPERAASSGKRMGKAHAAAEPDPVPASDVEQQDHPFAGDQMFCAECGFAEEAHTGKASS